MKLRLRPIKSALLGAALLLLSAKGAQELAIDQSFSLIVNLPVWLVALKEVVDPAAAALMAAFVILAVSTGKRFVCPPVLAGYVIVLAYYFLRSAWLGSDVQSNLLGCVILLAYTLAISLDPKPMGARGAAALTLMRPLSYFCHGYVAVTFSLWIAGYGYPQVGARFMGMTYHPNAEGAFAAICAGTFLARAVRPSISSRRRLIENLFFVSALFLVVASGSRTATLMVLLAGVCLAPARYAAVAIIATFGAFFFLPEVGTFSADASIGGAVSRMLSATTGNRDGVWARLLFDFYAHPFLGVGDTSSVSGSGFLTAFAGDGLLFGLVFLAVSIAAAKQALKRIIGFRRDGGWSPRLAAAVLMLQILLGSVFEATLFDKFSPFPLLTMVFLIALFRREQINSAPNGGVCES